MAGEESLWGEGGLKMGEIAAQRGRGGLGVSPTFGGELRRD